MHNCVSFSSTSPAFATSQTPKASPYLTLRTFAPAFQESITTILERDWHHDIIEMVRERLPKFLVILVVLFIFQRLIDYVARRLQRAAARHENVARTAQIRTMATMARATSYSIFGFILFLQLLTLLNINYAPLLASAGILGVGIGLGAQSLFKDVLNGIFILLEDQYNVGEVVKVAGLTGTVEDLTLRLTRVRDGDGTLYIIPNSQIATVSNLSRDYSLATLQVAVDASVNPDRVIATLTRLADTLRDDPAFTQTFIDKPNILGVDKIDGRSILYPINFRTLPNKKDPILRELRRRIVIDFEHEGIPLGSDSSLLIMQQAANSKPDPTAPPAQQPLVT